ncbi:hypothetical protein SO802_022405 [Lithocarpus litseifolius]|uniref:Uncharacterized protein n=1 Tax=Lithocarpus litseifolius TaxID=425828 RepID=A0AAW2CHN0_9ROSI
MKFKTPAYFGEEEESCSHTPEEEVEVETEAEGRGQRQTTLTSSPRRRTSSLLYSSSKRYIIRDEHGNWVRLRDSQDTLEQQTVLLLNFGGLGMDLCCSLNIPCLIVELDAKMVVL